MKNNPLFYKETSCHPFYPEDRWIKRDCSCTEPSNKETDAFDNEEHLLY